MLRVAFCSVKYGSKRRFQQVWIFLIISGFTKELVMTTPVVTDKTLGAVARRQNDLFRRVREGTLPANAVLRALQYVIEGNFDAIPAGLRRIIDCDVMPYVPDGWKIEKQLKGGEIEFDASRITFHLDDGQMEGRTIVGNDLCKRFADKPVLNVCVLDHLLANTNLIPKAWKKNEDGTTRYTYFWGTIYRGEDGHLCVRCLYWYYGRWRWLSRWLHYEWGAGSPAALLAS